MICETRSNPAGPISNFLSAFALILHVSCVWSSVMFPSNNRHYFLAHIVIQTLILLWLQSACSLSLRSVNRRAFSSSESQRNLPCKQSPQISPPLLTHNLYCKSRVSIHEFPRTKLRHELHQSEPYRGADRYRTFPFAAIVTKRRLIEFFKLNPTLKSWEGIDGIDEVRISRGGGGRGQGRVKPCGNFIIGEGGGVQQGTWGWGEQRHVSRKVLGTLTVFNGWCCKLLKIDQDFEKQALFSFRDSHTGSV